MSPLIKLARDTAKKVEGLMREHAQKEILVALRAAHNLGVTRENKRIVRIIEEA